MGAGMRKIDAVYAKAALVTIIRIAPGAADIRSCCPTGGPESVPRAGAAVDRPKGQHGVGTGRAPAHADSLHSLLHDVTDRALHGAAANGIPGGAEGLVPHPLAVGRQVPREIRNGRPLGDRAWMRPEEAETGDNVIDPT